MNVGSIIKAFNLKPFGSQGWLKGQLSCPDCGRNDKFGILFANNKAVTHCFYCSTSYSLRKILWSIGRQDLIDGDVEYELFKGLKELGVSVDNDKDKSASLPIGFRRINHDEYLDSRGFEPWQYIQYGVGVSEVDPKVIDKLVFQIFQHGKLSGWLGRSRHSKEWHDNNLKAFKRGEEQLVLRYRNSENDFNEMLGGIDEVLPGTDTLILVEGLFDKANVDRLLDIKPDTRSNMKCCFTFGSELSDKQVSLIPRWVTKVIMMYDKGTVNNVRRAIEKLNNRFNVFVSIFKDEEVDPGNMTYEYFYELVKNIVDSQYFYRNVLSDKLK